MTSLYFIQQITQKFIDVLVLSLGVTEETPVAEKYPAIRVRPVNTPDSFDVRSTGKSRSQSAVAPSP